MRNRHVIPLSFRATGARFVGGDETFHVAKLNHGGIFVVLGFDALAVAAAADLQGNALQIVIFVDDDGGFRAEVYRNDAVVNIFGGVSCRQAFRQSYFACGFFARAVVPQIPMPAIRVG